MCRIHAAFSIWALLLAACTPSALNKTLALGASARICQLTGDTDWRTGGQTTTLTRTRFGLGATDLGYPVEHAGRLALLFGDTWPNHRPHAGNETFPPDDAVGWITSRAPPTANACTDLQVNHVAPPLLPIKLMAPAQVVAPSPIKQGYFNVPSGGVSSGGKLYAFFWTDHCMGGGQPCPERFDLNNVGRGVVAESSDGGRTFRGGKPMPPGFVYSTAVNAAEIASAPARQKLGTFVFGVPRYRESVPYLALAPPGSMGEPEEWLFFIGTDAAGRAVWTSSEVWARGVGGPWRPPGRPELFSAEDARCVGELSVTWNQALGVWLLLYNCDKGPQQGIVARIADAPWGPWSEPQTLLNPARDASTCNLLMGTQGCGNQESYWDTRDAGALYAPFVLERYTTRLPRVYRYTRRAQIYWLVSTWNPYQVTVMQTLLEVTNPPMSITAERGFPLQPGP